MDEFRQFLKEYKWRVIGIAGGILLAVLIFTIGFWRTLLLTAITALCYFVGCILDKGGKEGLQEALSRLFRGEETYEDVLDKSGITEKPM